MPNWVNNTLVISVPSHAAKALLAEIEGPEDWPYPLEAGDMMRRAKPMSEHDQIRFQRDLDSNLARFETLKPQIGWPSWMRPSQADLHLMLENPERLKPARVPFSIARLAPYRDESEFDGFFPSKCEEKDDPRLWRPDNDDGSYNAGRVGLIALRQDRIGVKWPPSQQTLATEEDAETGRTRITIRYDTPWGPICDLSGLLLPVLARHDAKAACLWVEEGMNSGYDHMDPERGIDDSSEFIRDEFSIETEEDEDGETYVTFDNEGFYDRVASIINDPDLVPHE